MKIACLFLIGYLLAVVTGGTIAFQICIKEIIKWRELSDKHLGLFLLMNQWVKIKQKKKKLEEYLIRHNFRTIAVYGMSYVGERLVEELEDSEVKIAYGIDRNSSKTYADIEMVSPDCIRKEVDAVIVTSIYFMDEIKRNLSVNLSCPIISLEDILGEL